MAATMSGGPYAAQQGVPSVPQVSVSHSLAHPHFPPSAASGSSFLQRTCGPSACCDGVSSCCAPERPGLISLPAYTEQVPITATSPVLDESIGALSVTATQSGAAYGTSVYNGTRADNILERMTVKVEADQPVVPVPVYQEVQRRTKYVEVPHKEVKDTIIPQVYSQPAYHEVPNVDIVYKEKPFEVSTVSYVDKPYEVPVSMGYTPKFVPKWDLRAVPRPMPKYVGEQKTVKVEVPDVRYIDKCVEKEVVVDIQEKRVPKVVQVEKEVPMVEYHWKQHVKDVPVYRYVPKFDVELDMPPPLIVPYPETAINTHQLVQKPLQETDVCCGVKNVCQPKRSVGGFQQRAPAHAQYLAAGAMQAPPPPPPQPSASTAASLSMQEGQLTAELIGSSHQPAAFAADTTATDAQAADASVSAESAQTADMGTIEALLGYDSGKEGVGRYVPGQYFGDDVQPNLEPTISYKGSVTKPPEFAGALGPISFKLHAIEVHQFIPLPKQETAPFLQMMPDCSMAPDTRTLESVFGAVPTGWADPTVTGMPCPMMKNIIEGKVKGPEPAQASLDKTTTTAAGASMEIPATDIWGGTAEGS